MTRRPLQRLLRRATLVAATNSGAQQTAAPSSPDRCNAEAASSQLLKALTRVKSTLNDEQSFNAFVADRLTQAVGAAAAEPNADAGKLTMLHYYTIFMRLYL